MCTGPATDKVTATKEELLDYHKHMYIIRRMEITCDTEYKVACMRSCPFFSGPALLPNGRLITMLLPVHTPPRMASHHRRA